MEFSSLVFKILFAAAAVFTVSACNHSVEIPFTIDEPEFPQPESKPVKFSEPWKINWTDSVTDVKPLVKKFDFNKLPIEIFDSTGFLPFAKKPEEVKFNYDALPDTIFNYDALPSKPLRFETSILEPPKLIKAGHPNLKTGASSLMYELGEQQGLIGSRVQCLLEDKTGFLWIATEKGVYRYDGENLLLCFRVLPTFVIFNMLEDKQGNIWMGTAGSMGGNGLYVIDRKGGTVRHLTTPQGLSSNFVTSILSDNNGRVWMTTYPNGINIIDEARNTIKYFDRRQGLSNNMAWGIVKDGKDNMWITTQGGGVNIVDLKNGKIRNLKAEQGLNNDTLNAILRDNFNRIWIADNADPSEINVVDLQQGTVKHFNKDQGLSNYIFRLLNDRKGNIWIGTTGNGINTFGMGVQIMDPAKEKVKLITTVNGLVGNNVRYLLQDMLGQIWIATREGLNMIGRNGADIDHAGNKDITAIAEDDRGKIWIGLTGSYTGVEIIDTATGLSRLLTITSGLNNDTIQNIIAENSNIWIGTNGGIDIIDSSHKTIEHIGKSQGFRTVNNGSIIKYKNGNIWIGTTYPDAAGVDVFDRQKKTINHFDLTHQLKKDTAVTDIKQDKQGRVWIATNSGGVYIIDPESNTMKYLDDAPGLKDNCAKLLLLDNQGDMWIGTDKGIYIINAKNDSLTSFSTREGLVNNNILSLHEYKGQIYVGTNGGVVGTIAGITIITTPTSSQKNWQVASYSKAQGIRKHGTTYNSDFVTKKGLFLWGDKGVTILNNAKEEKSIPHTYVTGIDIFNQPQYFANTPWSHINDNDTLWGPKKGTFFVKGQLPANTLFPYQDKMKWDSVTDAYNMPVNLNLPYYQNYLQFHFAQANLGSQDTTWYRYILQGIDKKWSDKTNNSYSQNYLNLPPGNYEFKVSSMFSGKWSTPVTFQFTISSPWWQTWWAWGMYILIMGGLVWTFSLYRSRKLKIENLRLEEKIAKRTNQLQQSLEELKATQTQLIQKEKMASLGELTAGIAHEIQNPLNFMNNFSEVNTELIEEAGLEIDKGNIDEVKIILNDIKGNEQKINLHGKRADAIVKGMLQHSQKSSGQKEPTDINKLADDYLRLSYQGIRAKDNTFKTTLKTDFDESIGNIPVIPQDIGRVLLNLYNNAFYAVNQKAESNKQKAESEVYEPTISVSTKKLDNTVEIKVSDNGNGIPQKIIDKIFQPFFTTKPTGQGTGLGLSLSYDIIKAHGGEIKVETKEGEGSIFIIDLTAY